jgi:hypothetical protein
MGIERFAMGDTARKENLRTQRLAGGCLNVSCQGGKLEDGAVEGGSGDSEVSGYFGDWDVGGF